LKANQDRRHHIPKQRHRAALFGYRLTLDDALEVSRALFEPVF
jgi:hypothetical protein